VLGQASKYYGLTAYLWTTGPVTALARRPHLQARLFAFPTTLSLPFFPLTLPAPPHPVVPQATPSSTLWYDSQGCGVTHGMWTSAWPQPPE